MIIRSDATLKEALAKKKALMLIQDPGKVLFHDRLTGVHSKMVTTMETV